jgi:hypothetical protein
LPELRSLVTKIRSKNAGPFWLTIDIFCGSQAGFERVRRDLSTNRVAEVFGADGQDVKRFDIADLAVIKFSLPRPQTQGSAADRDMHGASWAALLGEVEI